MADKPFDEKEIFNDARQIVAPDKRMAYVEKACGQDPGAVYRIMKLLGAYEDEKSFLEASPVAHGATVAGCVGDGPGTVIGSYKLLEQIGAGGFGVVFMAEQQQPVRRKVALKVIKPGMDSRQVVARFEAERQALALMDHPNIARVFDGGETAAGRPYFVMELVHGIPITEFCDQNHLPLRERLELFINVCQAVQHAHQKGIIHRDLKPNNVLVTLHDDKAVVKVIDFGIAKATGHVLTEKTLFTNFAQLIGTPLYMSPEQAQMSGLDLDTRSDIFSLGVLLYELLTGSTPFNKERLETAGYDEMRRIIREEEPLRPSQQITTLGAALTAVSAQRKVDPNKLSQIIRGELDWIVMKALEKDRNRRYETASAFAADVQRYLNDEHVQACPPSAGYRLQKLLRRHHRLVLAASIVMLSLLAGIIGTTWGMIRALDAEDTAVTNANQKEIALLDKEAALKAAKQSKREADEKLFESYLGQAWGLRLSKRPGQRFESLEILKRATDLARVLDLPAEKFHELRNGAIAAMALPDLCLTGPWIPTPANYYAFDADEAHTIYARTDRQGNCSVLRVTDDFELHSFPGLGEPALPHLSPDGRFVAVAHIHLDGPAFKGVAVHLWALDETKARKIGTEQKDARRVSFHPRGHKIALAYNNGAIRLFDLPSGQPIGPALSPNVLDHEIEIALHPSEPLVAVCSYFKPVVQVRDVHSGAVVATLPQAIGAYSAVWSPDGRTLAVGAGEGGLIHLYDRKTLKPYRMLRGSGGGLHLAFNHAGDRLAAVGWGSEPKLFDLGTGQKLFATAGYALPRFSRDDRRLAGAADGKVGFWQVGDGREYRKLVRQAAPQSDFRNAALHPNGWLLAASMQDGFGLWDLNTGCELAFAPTSGGIGAVLDVRFEPSGELLTAGVSGLFRWPVRADSEGRGLLSIGPPQRLLPSAGRLGQSADGKVLVTGIRAVGQSHAYSGAWVLHAERPDQPIRLDAGADITFISVSPDGHWVVTDTLSGIAKVWNARDGAFVKQLSEVGAYSPCFSPDSRWLHVSYFDGGRHYAAGTWEPGPRVDALGVFAPDNQLMAVQPTAGVIRLVDRETGREFARFEDPEFDETQSLIFTPDGAKLIGLGTKKDKAIRVWDLRLIRQHLKALGLDWDRPDYPPADDQRPTDKPPKVVVVSSSPVVTPLPAPALTPEQKALQAIEKYFRAVKDALPLDGKK